MVGWLVEKSKVGGSSFENLSACFLQRRFTCASSSFKHVIHEFVLCTTQTQDTIKYSSDMTVSR